MYHIGIDLGGTKIEGVVLDAKHRELYRERVPTEQESGYTHILSNIRKLYNLLLEKIGHEEHSFGIGTPGSLSPKTGLLKNSNTLCLNKKSLKRDLEDLLNRKIEMQNDANCFALTEALCGAAIGKDLVFGVIMGTGCGGGIVYKGKVLSGLQGIAGEWGHACLDPNGPNCWCGSRGCIETFISGGGLEKLYEKQFGERTTMTEITANYRKKDQAAEEFMHVFFRNFGRAMANIINILDPDIVVLGGGLSNIDELYTEGVREVHRFIFSDGFETPIVKNQHGDSAGVIGAALIGI